MSSDRSPKFKSRYRYHEPICTSTRPLDMAYDPNFIYSSRVDQCRDAKREAHKLIQRRRWRRRPCNYECLLDNSTHEMNQTVTLDPSTYGDLNKKGSAEFYYRQPVKKPSTPPPERVEREKEQYIADASHQDGRTHSCGIQTLYRESEVQTDIWQPPDFRVTCWEPYPEILLLAQLGWKLGFEPTMHEVKIIKRMRIRRAWEKCLPPLIDQKARAESERIFNALQIAEWHLREEFIKALISLRLELAENELEGFSKIREKQLMERLERYHNKKKSHNKMVLFNLDLAHCRSIRREAPDRNKHYFDDQIKQHANRTSETYVHLKREGYLGKHRNLEIGDEIANRLTTTPNKLDELMYKYYKPLPLKSSCKQPKGWELCIRYSKYTEEKLESLVKEMKKKRMFKKPKGRETILENDRVVWNRIDPEARPPTPTEAEGVDDRIERRYQAATFLQKIIRGRTIQEATCTGRRDCAELIEEFRCTHALHKLGYDRLVRQRLALVNKQRSALISEIQRLFNEGILWDMAGLTISSTLDFMSKELERLLDERRIHAQTLLAERARLDLECLEAKQRQRELARRREQDAMFMQIMKVTQDSVDLYLQDVITESSEWASARETREKIHIDAHLIDEAANASLSETQDYIVYQQITELVHSFVLPEAIKSQVRKNYAEKQKLHLKVAHEYIYGDIDEEDLRDFLRDKSMKEEIKEEKSSSLEDLKSYVDENLGEVEIEIDEDAGSYENYVARIEARLKEKNYTLYDYLRSLRQFSFDKSELEILKHLNLLKPKEEKEKKHGFEDLENSPRSNEDSEKSEKIINVIDL